MELRVDKCTAQEKNHQTQNFRSTSSINKWNNAKNLHLSISLSNYRKSKIKKESLKKAKEEKNILYLQRNKGLHPTLPQKPCKQGEWTEIFKMLR